MKGKEYKALIKRAGDVERADLHFANGSVEFVTISLRVMLVQEIEGNGNDAVSIDMEILQSIAEEIPDKADVKFDLLGECNSLRITSTYEDMVMVDNIPIYSNETLDHRSTYGDVQPEGGPVYMDVDTLARLASIAKGTKGLVLNSGFPRATFHALGEVKLHGTVATYKT